MPVAFEQYTMKKALNINSCEDLLATDHLRNRLYDQISIGKKLVDENGQFLKSVR